MISAAGFDIFSLVSWLFLRQLYGRGFTGLFVLNKSLFNIGEFMKTAAEAAGQTGLCSGPGQTWHRDDAGISILDWERPHIKATTDVIRCLLCLLYVKRPHMSRTDIHET